MIVLTFSLLVSDFRFFAMSAMSRIQSLGVSPTSVCAAMSTISPSPSSSIRNCPPSIERLHTEIL